MRNMVIKQMILEFKNVTDIILVEMKVRRDALLEESMVHFKRKAALNKIVRIIYNGEDGYDAG